MPINVLPQAEYPGDQARQGPVMQSEHGFQTFPRPLYRPYAYAVPGRQDTCSSSMHFNGGLAAAYREFELWRAVESYLWRRLHRDLWDG